MEEVAQHASQISAATNVRHIDPNTVMTSMAQILSNKKSGSLSISLNQEGFTVQANFNDFPVGKKDKSKKPSKVNQNQNS